MGLLSSFQSSVSNKQSISLCCKILKSKKKASSLMEVIVASIIIVLIFGIATLTLNNIVKNNFKTQTNAINNHFNKLEYLVRNHKISIPYQDKFQSWDVSIEYTKQQDKNILFTAIHKKSNKEITRNIHENNH